jgi:hypothetical protein
MGLPSLCLLTFAPFIVLYFGTSGFQFLCAGAFLRYGITIIICSLFAYFAFLFIRLCHSSCKYCHRDFWTSQLISTYQWLALSHQSIFPNPDFSGKCLSCIVNTYPCASMADDSSFGFELSYGISTADEPGAYIAMDNITVPQYEQLFNFTGNLLSNTFWWNTTAPSLPEGAYILTAGGSFFACSNGSENCKGPTLFPWPPSIR